MNKLLMSAAMAAMFGAMIPAAHAATLGPTNFTVRVDLTAVCTTAAIPDLDFGIYTALTGGASIPAPTSAFNITCTRGLAAPTYAFDVAGGSGFGVIAGLNYSLAAAQTAIAAGAPATAALGVVGGPDVRTITITGGMAGAQAGACGGLSATACAGATTQTRTLTITY